MPASVDLPSQLIVFRWRTGSACGSTREMMELFKEMERRGVILSITLADGDMQVAEMKEVIEECPGLKVGHRSFQAWQKFKMWSPRTHRKVVPTRLERCISGQGG